MKLFYMIFLSLWISISYGQGISVKDDQRRDASIQLKFDQQSFGDRFSVLAASDDQYDYYAIDLTKLGGDFEKIYFMNLTYEEARIVNLDADLSKDQTWFKSYFTNTENDITCLFNDLEEKTVKASQGMSLAEKNAWMDKFNKFNKTTKND